MIFDRSRFSDDALRAIDEGRACILPVGRNSATVVDAENFRFLSLRRWQLSTKGYAFARFKRGDTICTVYLQRLVADPPVGMVVDHKNHDPLDNRVCNLRVCTQSQNLQNARLSRRNSSGFKGVHFYKAVGKWGANTSRDKKRVFLGLFGSPQLAAEAIRLYHKGNEFACLEAA